MKGAEKNYQIANFSDLEKFCHDFSQILPTRALILLKGGLGAGKTKTVEYLLRTHGIQSVTSPTFTIHNSYDSKNLHVDHFDLYRVESESDLESTGLWDTFARTSGWIIIEWPDKNTHETWPLHWPIFEIEISLKNSIRVFKTNF
jgi:tRNA threonylcarbamoyl adenosine modification protein YjeE